MPLCRKVNTNQNKLYIFRYYVSIDVSGQMKYFAASVRNEQLYEIWIHLALVYKGPENQYQGTIIYRDGIQKDSSVNKQDYDGQKHSSGVFKIGRLFEDPNSRYSRVMVDELSIWNRQLDQTEIQAVMRMTENPSG